MQLARLKSFDGTLFILMVLLIILGLSVQYSLSLATEAPGLNNFTKQFIFALVGLILFFGLILVDFRFVGAASWLIYILIFLLLVGVLIFGQTLRGVKGWLNFGFFNLQPTELAKLAAIIVLAKFWQASRQPVRVSHLLVSFALILPLAFLIIRQPDLGSALIIIILWLGIFLLVNRNKKYVLWLLIILILISSFAWVFFLEDYQKNRILTYINPHRDPLGQGYQVAQSIVSVGSGQFFGRGFGLGTQSQLRFLPASETDFVFAVLAEELGLVGCLLLLGFYLALLGRLIRIARTVYDNFSQILVLGVTLYFFFQMVINIGMNIGLAPVIGVPLPFISYGGSSLLVSIIALALVESVIIHQPFTKSEEVL